MLLLIPKPNIGNTDVHVSPNIDDVIPDVRTILVPVVFLQEVSIIRYGAGVIEWALEELESSDTKNRKKITKYKSLHVRVDIECL